MHTRSANFGIVYTAPNGQHYALDTAELLCGFIQTLDERNIYLTTASERFEFLMEMYVTQVLGLNVVDAFDLIKSNDVEDLSYNTDYYRIMQQYTIYPIYDLYKLSWDKFIEQSYRDIQFQLKMAREYQTATKPNVNQDPEEQEIMVDESHAAKVATAQPRFKKSF